MAVAELTSVAAFASGLIAGPAYAHWKVAGCPPTEEPSAIELVIAATYLPKLPLNDHAPSPFGSQTTPTRGLSALSFTTRFPAASTPWFLSQRRPRLKVRCVL